MAASRRPNLAPSPARDHQGRSRRHPGRDPKDNPPFVVTNLKASPQHLYEAIHCARGDIENRIKELHHGLEIDRTSCTRFHANQLRALLTAAAYVLYQELRLKAVRTAFRRAQVSTLREQLLKLGAWMQSSARRIVLHLPASFPHLQDWQLIARSLGAAPRSAVGPMQITPDRDLNAPRRTPVIEMRTPRHAGPRNPSLAWTPTPKSLPCIDITTRPRNTWRHEHPHRPLHA